LPKDKDAKGADKIGASVSHSACLCQGQVYIWGVFGSQKNCVYKKPTIVNCGTEIQDFVLGDCLTVFLTKKGEVLTLGDNIDGQLGVKMLGTQNNPTLNKVQINNKIE
jgi:alpha-tubulin suppressor-like RCC1 family protein